MTSPTAARFHLLRSCRRHGFREIVTLLLLTSLVLQSVSFSAPAWWATQQVLTPNASADDFAVANVGQLKTLARKAAQQLDANLPGRAGAAIHTMLHTWAAPPASGVTRNDYAAVNLGQLKTVAKPFYDRLSAAGVRADSSYPWTGTNVDDYTLVNLGQLKTVFAFPITLPASLAITTTSLMAGKVGSVYTAMITAVHGIAPYTFSVGSGTGDTGLPHGYMLASNGALTGLGDTTGSQVAGTYKFTVQVTDRGGHTATKPMTLVLSPPVVTNVTPLSLNGQTTAFKPPLIQDFTGIRDAQPLILSGYKSGQPEDSPSPSNSEKIEVVVKEFQQPGGFFGGENWQDGTSVTAQSDQKPPGSNLTTAYQTTTLDSGHFEWQFGELTGYVDDYGTFIPYNPPQRTYGQVWVPDTISTAVEVDTAPIPWTQRQAGVKVSLSEADIYNDHTFQFQVSTANEEGLEGESSIVTLTIPKGRLNGNPDRIFKMAPPGGTASITLMSSEPEDDPPQDPDGVPYSVSGSDSAGPSYRKISLTGLPLPDAKPHVQDESGEREEETHVDAFNRHLHHGVTDIYATAPSTLLPLFVRRDVTSENWNRTGGLRPSERPDLPFGPCWSSNLCAFVRYVKSSNNPVMTAEVHDEQGVAQKFLAKKIEPSIWKHSREEMSNARTLSNTFDGLVLRRKFGTICTYVKCGLQQNLPGNRLQPSPNDVVEYTYARLTEVRDRLGNRLVYEYANDTTLIPSRIYDPDRSGRQIYIMHENGRVSSVRGPSGEQVSYDNTTEGLTSVMRNGAKVQYEYLNRIETNSSDTHPNSDTNGINAYYHTELASITDELQRKHSFSYQYDHSVIYIHSYSGGSEAQRFQLGLPMKIRQVTLPDGQVVTYDGRKSCTSRHGTTASVTADPVATTLVSGPAGQFTYNFSEPYVFIPQMFGPGLADSPRSLTTTVTYTQLDIISDAGMETFTFNKDAIFALSSATDLSGNTHSFIYGVDGWDDPVQEIDALGNSKYYTYEDTTRVMSSMTDQTGVVTSYQIQPNTGLKLSETVKDSGGVTKRQSTFQYNNPTYNGFMTQSTVEAAADDTAPPTVTNYALGTDTYGWSQVTEATPTATGVVTSTTVNDLSGNKRSVIDGRGMVTNFAYDGCLRLVLVMHPDGTFNRKIYDAHGNMTSEVDENTRVVFHDYDVFNRRIKTTVDLNGNRIADSSYTTVKPFGTSVLYDGDIFTSAAYNLRGQVISQTDARGKVTTHAYDSAGRLLSTNDGGLITTMTYGPNSGGSVFDTSGFKPTQITDPRGTMTALTYDAMYRTTSQSVSYSNPAPAQHLLKSLSATAQQNYADAQVQTVNVRAQFDIANESLNHAEILCDPVAAAAALDQAQNALTDAIAVLPAKEAAITTAEHQVLDAERALNNWWYSAGLAESAALSAYNAAIAAAAQAAEALRIGAAAVGGASDAYGVAQQNASTLHAAVDEDERQYTMRVSEVNAARLAKEAAQMTVDNLNVSLGIVVDQSSILDQLDIAYNDLSTASSTLDTAVAAKDAAETTLTAANTDADTADNIVTHTYNALKAVNARYDLNALQATAFLAQSLEESEDNNYHGIVRNDSMQANLLQGILEDKNDLRTRARSDLDNAKSIADAAQTTLYAAQNDLSTARNAVTHPQAMEVLQAAIADAQSIFDNASAALAAQTATETAALNLANDLQREWRSVEPLLGDNAVHTATTSTTYDDAGRPTSVTDALGRVTYTVYDVFGQIQSVTHPDNTSVSTAYTHHGKPWKVVDELGNTTTTVFDEAGRAVKTIAPVIDGVSATHITEYDAASNAIRVTDALGQVTESEYNERNRVVAVYAPPVWDARSGAFARPVTQMTYNAVGQVLTITDPLGNVTTKLYDSAGRNWKVIAPSVDGVSPTTITQFDPGGLAQFVTNPLGVVTTNSYDIHGRLTQTSVGDEVNAFAYDAVGNRISVQDGLGQETIFNYDGLNHLTWQTFANGDTWTYSYDAMRKVSQTSPRGITTKYTYDERDRVLKTKALSTDDTPALERNYSYDESGHLLGVTETGNTAANVNYTYDALGRVTTESSLGVTHTYSYDLAGNRTQASYGTGRSVMTGYDALNRPEFISEGGRVTCYGYDLAGHAVMLVAGNGQTSCNTYDALGRLGHRTLFMTTAMSDSEVLAEFTWSHDVLGNVTQQLEKWPGDASRSVGVRSTKMTYDGNNRLATEAVCENVDYPASGVTTTTYTYDNANNRLQKAVTGGSDPGVWNYAYNTANQLTYWEQLDSQGETLIKSANLSYDDSGNRTSQNVRRTGGATGSGINPPPAASGTTTYQWDAQDRLASVTLPDGTQHAYNYDYRTRRIGTHKLVSSVVQFMTAIVFAGGLSLAEYDSTTGTLPTAPTVEYTRGPDMGGGVGGMLYSVRSSSLQNQAPSIKYSLSNGRGDIVAQADSSATLTWTSSYEAYGRRTVENGLNEDKQRGNSKDEDPTGLLNEGFRYRDLETGVWLSRDPAGFVDGPNVYAYVKQNPWTGWDPEGLSVEVKRTPKASRDKPPAGMNKMQMSAWNNEQRKKDHGHHTEITIHAALLDETSSGHSPEDLAAIRDQITNSVNEKFTGQDGKDSWSMKLDLRIVKSAKEINADDHEIVLKDFVQAKSLSSKEFGGYALVSDNQFEKGQSGLGGNTIALSGKSIFNAQGKPTNFLNWLAPHEIGHSLGLSHPNDPNNPLASNPGARNLMWHKPPLGPQSNQVNKQQIDAINSNFEAGKLNQGRSSISEAFFYFSEKQLHEKQ